MLNDAQAEIVCCQSYLAGGILCETLHSGSIAYGREVIVTMQMPQNFMPVMQVPVSKHAMSMC